MKSIWIKSVMALCTGLGMGLYATQGVAQENEVVLGVLCDRTGPTQSSGVIMCSAIQDYVKLVNLKGGVEGRKVRALEIDTEYKVPQGIEAYERFKKDGAVSILLYGTPHVQSLQQRMAEDRIPGTSPGFGTANAADGVKYPYLFPIAATFYSQGAAAVKFAGDKIGGLKGKKIGFLFVDNPTGREPIPVLEALAKREGFELKIFSVPPPGIEMAAQVIDISQRFKPDFLIANLFGRAPSVGIKALKRVGFPMDKVISLAWGAAESDLEAAGGGEIADGYYGLQFAGVGDNYQVVKDIKAMYTAEGKPMPKVMESTVYYNRALFHAAIQIEALRQALKKTKGGKVTGVEMKAGFESISKDSLASLGDLVPPLSITANDHEGGGWLQVFQVQKGKFTKVTDWFNAYPEVKAEIIKQGH
ncbi:ABC transporter substrate-binding protein [Rhodoferax sp.]|uniref:ABC transporter substrate-binding protein n=1 Tax=Rhodoferax sp. TaxID=50421 RepID=UPI0026366A43|nr:ABC transporter substrate-binding protein [Rhodoferax sp.]MDD3937611.1 ABC transporter substrate-binding protein [Rhodoferax sp.]